MHTMPVPVQQAYNAIVLPVTALIATTRFKQAEQLA
jgi:hypothetical protein